MDEDLTYFDFQQAMDEYHSFTDTVAVYPCAGESNDREFSYLALGLAGETGEAVDIIKKALRREQMTEQDREKLGSELGDILFYWTRIASAAGLSFSDIMEGNVEKLSGRKDTGTLKDR